MAVLEYAPRVTFEPLPTGDYVCTLLKYEIAPRDPDQYHKEKYQQIAWYWRVHVPGKDTEELRDWSEITRTFSEKSATVRILIALGVVDESEFATKGGKIDLDLALGHSCLATVIRQLKKDGKSWVNTFQAYQPLPKRGTNASTGARLVDPRMVDDPNDSL